MSYPLGISFDGGATWTPLAVTVTCPEQCSMGYEDEWVALVGGKIQYTADFGTTWTDKTGNLLTLVPGIGFSWGIQVLG